MSNHCNIKSLIIVIMIIAMISPKMALIAITPQDSWVYNVKNAYSADVTGKYDSSISFLNANKDASINGGTIIVPPGTYKISSNQTISPNVSIEFTNGAKLNIDDGVKFTISGKMEAGLYQIFSGRGNIYLSNGSVERILPQWWGAKGDGIADDTTAIQSALDRSIGATIYLVEGKYKITSTLHLPGSMGGYGCRFIGEGNGSMILTDQAITMIDHCISDSFTKSYYYEISGIHLDGYKVATRGLDLRGINESSITNVIVRNINGEGIYLNHDTGPGNPNCYNLTISSVKAEYCTTGFFAKTNACFFSDNMFIGCKIGAYISGTGLRFNGYGLSNDTHIQGINANYCEFGLLYLEGGTYGITLDPNSHGNIISNVYNDGGKILSSKLIIDNGYANNVMSNPGTSFDNIALNGEFRLWKDASTPAMWAVDSNANTYTACVPSSKTKNILKCHIQPGGYLNKGIYLSQHYRPVPAMGVKTIAFGTLMKRYTITPGTTKGGIIMKRFLYFFDRNYNPISYAQASNINWAEGTNDNDSDWVYSSQPFNLPAGTEFIRISFSLSTVNDLTVEGGVYISRFDVFLGSKSGILSNRDIETSVFKASGVPSIGTFATGDVIYEDSPTGGGVLTRQCVTTGTAGILNGGNTTGSILGGSNILTVSSLTGLYPGCYINIAGQTFQIVLIHEENKQVALDNSVNFAYNDVAITYAQPAFSNIFGTSVNTLNYSSTISCDVSSGNVFTLTTSGDCIINAKGTNAGQRLVFVITNDATNRHAVRFGTNFKSNGDLIGTINKTTTIEFICAGGSWYEINRMKGL